jgi:hypothetical protein
MIYFASMLYLSPFLHIMILSLSEVFILVLCLDLDINA